MTTMQYFEYYFVQFDKPFLTLHRLLIQPILIPSTVAIEQSAISADGTPSMDGGVLTTVLKQSLANSTPIPSLR